MKKILVLTLALALGACSSEPATRADSVGRPAGVAEPTLAASASAEYTKALNMLTEVYRTQNAAYKDAMTGGDIAGGSAALTLMAQATESFTQTVTNLEPQLPDKAFVNSYRTHLTELGRALGSAAGAAGADEMSASYDIVVTAQDALTGDFEKMKALVGAPSSGTEVPDSTALAQQILDATLSRAVDDQGILGAYQALGITAGGGDQAATPTQASGFAVHPGKPGRSYIATAIKDTRGVCTGLGLSIANAKVTSGHVAEMGGRTCTGQSVADVLGIGA